MGVAAEFKEEVHHLRERGLLSEKLSNVVA
jgi:hypothetical protein